MKTDSMIISLCDKEIVTIINGCTCYSEPNLFGIDSKTLGVVCHGLNVIPSTSKEHMDIVPVSLFGGHGRLVTRNCMKAIVKATYTAYKEAYVNPRVKVIVCVNTDCTREDMIILKDVLSQEGAVEVRFTTRSVKELEKDSHVGNFDLILPSRISPEKKSWLLVLACSVVYGLLGIYTADWISVIGVYILAVECIAVYYCHCNMSSLSHSSGIPYILFDRRNVLVFVLTLVVGEALLLFLKCHGVSYVVRGTLLLFPLALLLSQLMEIKFLKKIVFILERKNLTGII